MAENVRRAATDERAGARKPGAQQFRAPDAKTRKAFPGILHSHSLTAVKSAHGSYQEGYGDEPLPDYQGRALWYLISINGESARPNPGEVWWFAVDAYPGSRDRKERRWVQVLIPQGQDKYPLAARPELRIPGAAIIQA